MPSGKKNPKLNTIKLIRGTVGAVKDLRNFFLKNNILIRHTDTFSSFVNIFSTYIKLA